MNFLVSNLNKIKNYKSFLNLIIFNQNFAYLYSIFPYKFSKLGDFN